MDWIEKTTGLQLDGRTGAAEFLLVVVPLVFLLAVVWRFVGRNRRSA
ncbi:MAG: hypothetical protein JNM85_02460 [Chthonomonas sp.]|nr:hypothetical protein [Chthonomonas sp.]